MPGLTDTAHLGEGRRGVYLLTNPRSASNLFQTMMSKQPGFQSASYKFFDAGFGSLMQLEKGPLSQWPQEERKALYDAYQAGFDSLQDEFEDAQKNVSIALLLLILEMRAGCMDILDDYEVTTVVKGLKPPIDSMDNILCLPC